MNTLARRWTYVTLAVIAWGGLHGCHADATSAAMPVSPSNAPRSPSLDEQPEVVGKAPAGTTAHVVLLRMDATYGACRSYTDRVLQRAGFRDGRRARQSLTFTTNFVRGGGFRLDVQWRYDGTVPGDGVLPDSRIVVWGDNESAREWWDRVPGTPMTTLGSALGHASGVTNEWSDAVPSLLLPHVVHAVRLPGGPEGALALLDDPLLLGIESFAGHDCFKLRGGHGQHTTDVWIDCETYLLRRSSSTSVRDDGAIVDRVTAYDPTIDTDIPASVFAFEPPK